MAETDTRKSNKQQQEQHPNVRGRVLPHNDEAEQSLLGCMLIDENAPITILSDVKKDDFFAKRNANIFEAMRHIYDRGQPIDIVTLVQECEVMGVTEEVGGIAYLTSLTTFVPSADNYRHYMGIVKKNGLLRRLIVSAQNIMDKAYGVDGDDTALSFAEAEIYRLAETEDRSSLVNVQEAADEAIAVMEQIYRDHGAAVGVPIPYKKLNAMLNGFHGSDLVLIAARPGQGKTSIGMNFIAHAALNASKKTPAGNDQPLSCAVFSLEMSAAQLAKRLLCSVAKVNMRNASNGHLSTDEWKRLKDAQRRINKSKIFIDDNSLTTPAEILSKCRRLKREHGLDLIMVDYLQLMSSGRRSDNRQQEVSDITRTMKIAAKELDVPILLLSQMSREVEKRVDKRPQMSDLRESGAIEQDADIIMFLYRKHDLHDDTVSMEERTRTQIIVSKHRNGEVGDVDVRWHGEFTTFEDIEPDAPLPPAAQKPEEEGGALVRLTAADEVFGTAEVAATLDDAPPFDTVQSEGGLLKPSDEDLDI